jgi:hypothetical protein
MLFRNSNKNWVVIIRVCVKVLKTSCQQCRAYLLKYSSTVV